MPKDIQLPRRIRGERAPKLTRLVGQKQYLVIFTTLRKRAVVFCIRKGTYDRSSVRLPSMHPSDQMLDHVKLVSWYDKSITTFATGIVWLEKM